MDGSVYGKIRAPFNAYLARFRLPLFADSMQAVALLEILEGGGVYFKIWTFPMGSRSVPKALFAPLSLSSVFLNGTAFTTSLMALHCH